VSNAERRKRARSVSPQLVRTPVKAGETALNHAKECLLHWVSLALGFGFDVLHCGADEIDDSQDQRACAQPWSDVDCAASGSAHDSLNATVPKWKRKTRLTLSQTGVRDSLCASADLSAQALFGSPAAA
jgi:hypothetical protein